MKPINTPFVILTFSTLIGIIIGYYIFLELTFLLLISSISLGCLCISWLMARKLFRKSFLFSILTIVTFLLFGITLIKVHNPKNHLGHYINNYPLQDLHKNPKRIQFHIKERLKPTHYYEKYIISLEVLDDKNTKGSLLLQIPKEELIDVLTVGDVYIVYSSIEPIPKPLNPYQFDYAQHLSLRNILHKLTVSTDELIKTNMHHWSIYSIADQIRTDINQKLRIYKFEAQQLSIINALFLGQRQDINEEVLSYYRDAGVLHILAVSGLHVGIIMVLLNFILKPLNYYKKNRKIVKAIIIILFLWCFAIVAGLSPSILRAATMFSFVTIGMQFRSKTSIYNALFVSMFILLCFNPLLVFSIGFQLSYLAVFSIVWIQPCLAKFYKPKFIADKKLWEILTVTFSAQLGVLPLTLFYFHQFPLLFFVANLIILPFLEFILGLGIAVIIFAQLEAPFDWLATIFGGLIDRMNQIVYWTAKQESFLISEIPFSGRMLLTSYILIIFFVFLLKKYTLKRLFIFGTSISILFCVLIYEKHLESSNQELIVFHNQRNTMLGILQDQQLRIYSTNSISKSTRKHLIKNYYINNNVKKIEVKTLKNAYSYKEKNIIVIDSSGIYDIPKFSPEIILLSRSPKIHLNRMIETLKPKLIIADASNYKSYLNQWEVTCIKQNIPFHRTDKKGAFILKN